MEIIRELCAQNKIIWTAHALKRQLQRNISRDDVKAALMQGRIIEEYPQDYPNPSCLVLAGNIGGAALHVVCGVTENSLWIITSYRPSERDWESDWATRKRGTK